MSCLAVKSYLIFLRIFFISSQCLRFQKKPTLDLCVMIVFFVCVNVKDNDKVPEILYAVKAIKRASLIEIVIQSKCLYIYEEELPSIV